MAKSRCGHFLNNSNCHHTAVLIDSQPAQRIGGAFGVVELGIVFDRGNYTMPAVVVENLDLHPAEKRLACSIIRAKPSPRHRFVETHFCGSITPISAAVLPAPIRVGHQLRWIIGWVGGQCMLKAGVHELLIRIEADRPPHYPRQSGLIDRLSHRQWPFRCHPLATAGLRYSAWKFPLTRSGPDGAISSL